MKFLIHDYSTPWNTEPLYLNATLNLFNQFGIQSTLYDSRISLYDNLDRNNPDCYILDIENINSDLMSYLQDNNKKAKKLKLLINMSKANEEIINTLQEKFSNVDLNFTFFGDKYLQLKNYCHILPSVDLFLANIHFKKEYNIDKLIFVYDDSEITDYDGSYHYTTLNLEIKDKVDFVVDISHLQRLFVNYENIIFKNSCYIGTEVCFNAIYTGIKTTFEPMDNDIRDKLDLVFKGEKLLKSVKNYHTCLNRVQKLASIIDCKDILNNVHEIESRL